MLLTNNVKSRQMTKPVESERLWKEFGKWIKSERENGRPFKTQKQVAKKVGISEVHYSRIENGKSTRRDTVIAIAEAISTDAAEALKRAGFETGEFTRSDERALGELSHHLPRFQRLSQRSQQFVNKQLSSVIEFLLETEAEKAQIVESSDAQKVIRTRDGEVYPLYEESESETNEEDEES